MSGRGEVIFLQLEFRSLQSKTVCNFISLGSLEGLRSIIIGMALAPVATSHHPDLIYNSFFDAQRGLRGSGHLDARQEYCFEESTIGIV